MGDMGLSHINSDQVSLSERLSSLRDSISVGK